MKDGGTAKVSAGSVPLHAEDLIQVHLYSGEDYMATYRCKCQPGFKHRAGEILSSKSGCPEQTALGTHVPKRPSAAMQNIPMALPGKGSNVLSQPLTTSLLAPPGSSAQGVMRLLLEWQPQSTTMVGGRAKTS